MNEQQATAIADALGGEAWQSGGGMWVVTINRSDGKLIGITDDAICMYADDTAFDRGEASDLIELNAGIGDDSRWVVQDAEGDVFYRNPDMKVGWRSEEEAEHEARALQSRTGTRCFVRELADTDS